MKKTIEATSRIVKLADRLENDIRERNLPAGTPYFSAQDAAKYLGVAGEAANFALQLLEKRRVIKRRRRIGAVVASVPTNDDNTVAIRNIYFFISKSLLANETVGSPKIFLGIQQHFPEADIVYNYIRPGREIEQVGQAVRKAFDKKGTDAFVLGSAPFEVQQVIASSGIPAVIYGSRYPGVKGIPQLERDYVRMARTIRSFAKKSDRKRPLILMPLNLYAGDDRLVAELTRVFRHRLDFRFAPQSEGAASDLFRQILAETNPPDMVVSHDFHITNEIRPLLREESRRGNDISLLTLGIEYGTDNEPDPHFILDFEPEELGSAIGRLLLARINGKNVSDRRVPVRLVEP